MPARPDDFGEQLRALALRLLRTDPVFRMRHQIAVRVALQTEADERGGPRGPRSWSDVYAAERGVGGEVTRHQVEMAAAVALAIAGTDPNSFPVADPPPWVAHTFGIDGQTAARLRREHPEMWENQRTSGVDADPGVARSDL